MHRLWKLTSKKNTGEILERCSCSLHASESRPREDQDFEGSGQRLRPERVELKKFLIRNVSQGMQGNRKHWWYPHRRALDLSWNKVRSALCSRPRQGRVKVALIPRRERDLQKDSTKTDLEYCSTDARHAALWRIDYLFSIQSLQCQNHPAMNSNHS